MKKRTLKEHAFTFSVSALAAVIASVSATTALAQEELEEIQVTGSRIQRTGMSAPTPVTAISQDEMEVLSPTTLMGALEQLPQFLGSATLEDTSNFFGGGYLGAGGQSNLNLRGVGGNRTLVLLDGRRIVPSNRNSTIDISLFPQALIRRTEVVTGGASAAYGSDAVTGVTNFIMDTDFEGFDAHLQTGVSELGDANNYRASFAGGFAVGERGHFVIGVDGYKSDEITDIDGRDWYQSWGDMDFGTNVQPRRVRYENTQTRAETFGGLITRGPLAGTQFIDDGIAVPFHNGDVLNASALSGVNAVSADNPRGIYQGNQVGGSGDQFDRTSLQRAELKRSSVYANFKYELTENITASLSGLYGYSDVDNQKVGYVMSTTWFSTIYRENPFLPDPIRARMDELDLDSFRLDKRVSAADPLHNGRAPLLTDVASLTAALEGTLANDWNWRFYAQYGESNRDVEMFGFRIDRMARGIDSVVHPETGAIVCRSTLIQPNDGCVPINILGFGNVSEQGLEYLHDSMFTNAKVRQGSSEFVLDGEIYEGWGAGPIFMAVGANWRKDSVNQLSGDPLHGAPIPANGEGLVTPFDENGVLLYRGLPSNYMNGSPVIDRTAAASFQGGFNVYEGFVETITPLVRDVPFAQGLDLSLAARYTDYEVSGPVWAWKAGIDWQVVDDLRLRLTRSRDIRAGNLSEMFDSTSLFNFFDDPWRPNDETYIALSLNGGNPGVDPEEADTLTYGGVYQPSWLPGLALSLDYFEIEIASAISTIGAQNIVDYCFEESLFCEQITFAPGGPGAARIATVDNRTLNVGEAKTRGLDIEMSYRTDVDFLGRDESVALRLLGSHLIEASVTPFDSPTTEQAGTGNRQEWHVTATGSYTMGAASASWSTRWVSSAKRSNNWVEGIDVADNDIPSHSISNLRLNYDFGGNDGGATSVYLSVNNVFDGNPGDLDGLTGIYDIIGRNYTVGVRYRL